MEKGGEREVLVPYADEVLLQGKGSPQHVGPLVGQRALSTSAYGCVVRKAFTNARPVWPLHEGQVLPRQPLAPVCIGPGITRPCMPQWMPRLHFGCTMLPTEPGTPITLASDSSRPPGAPSKARWARARAAHACPACPRLCCSQVVACRHDSPCWAALAQQVQPHDPYHF